MKDFTEMTNFLVELSTEATDIMLRYYSGGGIESESKADNSPVTRADIEVNNMVITRVQERYPEFGIFGEEESDHSENNKLFVVDPIDGTHMFAIGSPLFVFSAAIVIDGEVIAGILCNPLARRTLLAEKGKGAYLMENSEKISVSDKQDFDGALINAGWKDISLPEKIHAERGRTPSVYSVCEAASLIATGGFDGGVFTGGGAYDFAASKVIVEEAGGKMTNIRGNEDRYDGDVDGAIISNGHLHDKLLSFVRESRLLDSNSKGI